MVFETERLIIRKATLDDVEMYFRLWNSPDVMRNVGSPCGLKITRDRISEKIMGYDGSEFDQTLVVINKSTKMKLGECKLGLPDKEHIASTDIKLFPEFWYKGFGKEIKNALCKYLFQHTKAKIIKASPNIKNEASQRLQEACGGVKINEGVYHFPPEMQHYTEDVHCIIYHIKKENWLGKNLEIKKITDPDEKSMICRSVILSLPDWFGLQEANKEYIENVKKTEFYAAYMFDEPVGFYSIIRHFPETAEIYVCGILTEFHRLGIGTELQRVVEKVLSLDNAKYLTVKTLSSSHPDLNYANTRKFYTAVGFRPVEEFKTLWGEAYPCLFLLKDLY
jgi:RimJ/RimL family protein N-acetyltransferase/GNAT superfamily N-acetyltransferase